jgi:hypothetical protein
MSAGEVRPNKILSEIELLAELNGVLFGEAVEKSNACIRAILDHNDALHAQAVWTTNKPTVAGYWWYRLKDKFEESPVLVEGNGSEVEPFIVQWGYDEEHLVDEMGGEWAGPLPMPREAT